MSGFTCKIVKNVYHVGVLKKYNAVIYDWDGCLLQSLPTWIDAYKQAFKKTGLTISTAKIVELLGNWDAPKLLGHPHPDKANKEILRHVHDKINSVPFYPNALEAISAFKNQGAKIFLVTSTKKQTIKLTKAYTKIEKLIDHAIFAEDVKHHKPHPEAINYIIDKFKLAKVRTAMIGDSDKDIIAAHNAGIDCLWFAPAENEIIHDFSYLESLTPAWRFADHSEIADMLSYKQTLQDS